MKHFFINLSEIFVLLNEVHFIMCDAASPVVVIDVKGLHKSTDFMI